MTDRSLHERPSGWSLAALARHQWCLALIGTLVCLGSLRRGNSLGIGLGVTVAVLGLTTWRGRSVATHLHDLYGFLTRSRWTQLRWRTRGDAVVVRARGEATCTLVRANFRGRLDVAGVDEERWRAVTDLLDRLSAESNRHHVSFHLVRHNNEHEVVMTLPEGVEPPPFWTPLPYDHHVLWPFGTWWYERWRYVEMPESVVAVFRVRDSVSATPLAELVGESIGVQLALHVDVVPATRATRVAARLTHARRSDAAVAGLWGFRQTAVAQQRLEEAQRREGAVARGVALLRVAAYVVVSAPNPTALEEAVRSLVARCRRRGVRFERGDGRHATWLAAALPGGPAW